MKTLFKNNYKKIIKIILILGLVYLARYEIIILAMKTIDFIFVPMGVTTVEVIDFLNTIYLILLLKFLK